MPIKIPVSYVPRAYVDFDAEARQILRQDFVLQDGCRIPPLTAGRLVALELISSPFFLHPFECEALDAAAALVLISCDRRLVEELTASSGSALRETAAKFLRAHGTAMTESYHALVEWILDVPFYGLNMLPRGGAQPREFWFDGTFVGGVVAAASKILATPVETIVWETPLCLVGHAIAQHVAACGVKGVERPPDEAVLARMMREAAEREQRGKLHPWQFDDPVTFTLTDLQANANPALIGVFAAMRAEFERNGRKPLDPGKFPIPPVTDRPEVAPTPAAISVPCSMTLEGISIHV